MWSGVAVVSLRVVTGTRQARGNGNTISQLRAARQCRFERSCFHRSASALDHLAARRPVRFIVLRIPCGCDGGLPARAAYARADRVSHPRRRGMDWGTLRLSLGAQPQVVCRSRSRTAAGVVALADEPWLDRPLASQASLMFARSCGRGRTLGLPASHGWTCRSTRPSLQQGTGERPCARTRGSPTDCC